MASSGTEGIERAALHGLTDADQAALRQVLARIFANVAGLGSAANTAEASRD